MKPFQNQVTKRFIRISDEIIIAVDQIAIIESGIEGQGENTCKIHLSNGLSVICNRSRQYVTNEILNTDVLMIDCTYPE